MANPAVATNGYMDGFRQGRSDGFRVGFCDAYVGGLSQENRIWDIHILYVTAGIGVPYPALDQAIIDALGEMVREKTVAMPTEDIFAIARKVQPDVVLVLNGVVLPAEQVEQLRRNGFRTAIWFTDDPYYTNWTNSIAPRYDYVFTLELNCLPFYRGLGCRHVYYLPFAVNPKAFFPKHVPTSHQTDICFIGTAFWNRVNLIDRLTPYLKDKKVVISGWWWDRLSNYSQLANQIKLGDWMTPEETANYYNGAKIVINLHRPYDDDTINVNSLHKIEALSVNPRTFEISGCATLQLSDIRQDMENRYVPGKEIDTYRSYDELIEKIDYYLRHEDERREVAMNGFIRTRREHTYRQRLGELLGRIFP
jgi:Uncharacterized protein conserved in bacteria